jgi:hypothetical protein
VTGCSLCCTTGWARSRCWHRREAHEGSRREGP